MCVVGYGLNLHGPDRDGSNFLFIFLPPPSDEERRDNARSIQSLTVPERFRLMFNPPTDDKAGDQA